jgi:hypothetical protein
MTRPITLLSLALLCACSRGGDNEGAPDSGVAVTDVGHTAPDSGAPVVDAGTTAADAGAVVLDAGSPGRDAGTPAADAGQAPVDIGDLLECELAMQCTLVPNQCCHPCGEPRADQLVAINRRQSQEANNRYCEGHDRNCPRCPERSPRDTLRATCLQNRCAMVDLEMPMFTTCSADTDCTMTLSMCCDSCNEHGVDDLIAVRRDQLRDVRNAYCGDRPPMCPACIGMIQPGLVAKCVESVCTIQAE